MPIEKDFKRLVRRRMRKTGESYTAARAQLLKTSPTRTLAVRRPPRSAKAPPVDYASIAGMSDAALKAKTGCDWGRWVRALDHAKAHTWPHRKIASYVHDQYEIPGWWAQAVTVGYERIRGLRAIGQRRDGAFEATKSRTFAVPVAALFEAFAGDRARTRWLPGVTLSVRKATPNRSVRITWQDGTSVEVWLTAKGAEKSAVQVQHRKLPDKESAVRTKAYWTERLDALARTLSA
jgi:hypothetical protein